MKRVALLPLPFLFLAPWLEAQSPSISQITITTSPTGARFLVDGTLYNNAAQFLWPTGSSHTLQFLLDVGTNGQVTNTQTAFDGSLQYTFSGWADNAGLLQPKGSPIQVITANPSVTSYIATLLVGYRIQLDFFTPVLADGQQLSCNAPGPLPPNVLLPGVVFVGSVCFAQSGVFYAPLGLLSLNAFPYPGFAFLGWTANGSNNASFLQQVTITGPTALSPQFTPAKRVHFLTNPLGLQVLIDRTTTPTRTTSDTTICPSNESGPVSPLTGIPPLCFGDFDFVPGSRHIISGVTPQIDINGNHFVFSSWSNQGGQNTVYTADFNTADPDTVTANFVAAAQVAFLTSPLGMKLSVDGSTAWPSYNFVWGVGSTHQVTAPASNVDSTGRQYTFQTWSNGGGTSQTVTVDPSFVASPLRMTAIYNRLNRVVVQSSPPGLSVTVDGTTCQTPCNIDRASGTQIQVSAPASVPVGTGSRLDFASWSDGGGGNHMYAVNADLTTLTANYTTMYQLATASNPAGGAQFTFTPTSPDGYFPANTSVLVTANPNPGFKFAHWDGALSGSYPTGTVPLTAPTNVAAELIKVPFIAPTGVANAVGSTPSQDVAPGSIISIFGQNLAPVLQAGPVNPLSQSIAGVAVIANGSILPLMFVSPAQINALLPSSFPPGDYTLTVSSPGQDDVTGTFSVARNAPGLFSQTIDSNQYAVGFHQDGTPLGPSSPAQNGETVTILGTGFGPYTPNVVDGFVAQNPAPSLVDSLQIAVGGLNPTPIFSGAAVGFTGVAATKFQITADMPSGSSLQLTVTVNGVTSNTVLLPIQ